MGLSTPPPPSAGPTAAAAEMSLVNLAARQRMLSQRLVLQTVLAAGGAAGQLEAARATLALFTDSQARLVDTPRTMDAASAAAIRAAYDGPRGTRPAIEAFRVQAETALDRIARQDRRQAESLDALVAQADGVLDPLNRVTSAFDAVARTRQEAVARELGRIVSSIQGVAREAKVVSFNAQVVAARAGQHGREFAVVAQVLASIAGQVDDLSLQAVRLSEQRGAA
jgi:methyl-accepting chemotaxis protein